MKRLRMWMVVLALLLPSLAGAIGVGDSAKVNWKGKWYDAVIQDVSGTRFLIHYTGYDNSWDEWVTLERVKIQVKWKGKWYRAKALKSAKGKVLIHYTGYDNSWDEWVGLDRIAAEGAGKSARKGSRSRSRTPDHVRESARDVPSNPLEFLETIERNLGR